jgi:hypothetical protein
MKPVILFKNMFVDVAISVNILVPGLAITIGWVTGVVSINLFYIIGSLIFGIILGLSGILWEASCYKSRKTEKRISFIPWIIQGILLISILLLPINEVKFYSLIVYFGYHIALLIALLLWQRQDGKRFRWVDLVP